MANASVRQLASNSFGYESSSNMRYFSIDQSGDWLLLGMGTEGFGVADISSLPTMSLLFQERCKDTGGSNSGHPNRRTLWTGTPGNAGARGFTITRTTPNNTIGATARIMEWDITDADPANWGPSSPLVIHEEVSAAGETVPLYSDAETDGTDIFVACQIYGAQKFSAADVSAGPSAENTTGSWETQGLCLGSSHVFYANYQYGLRCLLKSDMSDVDSISPPSIFGVTLRPWDLVIDENEKYLYASFNVDSGAAASLGGLIVYDVSNPASITQVTAAATTVFWDLSNMGGDAPCLRLYKHQNKIYMANGLDGILVFDVTDPTTPVLERNLKTSPKDDTTADCHIWRSGDTHYLAYGDAYNYSNTGSKALIVDQLYPEGRGVFTIGNYGSTATNTTGVAQTVAISHDVTSKTYTAVEGDIVTDYRLRVQDNSAARTFKIGLYTVSSGVPDVIVAGSEATVENTNDTDTDYRELSITGLSIALTAGVEYCVCVIQTVAGSGRICHDGGTAGSRDNSVTGGNFKTTWTESIVNVDAAVAALGKNIKAGTITGTVVDTII